MQCVFDLLCLIFFFFFFKQKTAYEMRISDWSSDVCSSDLAAAFLFDQRRCHHIRTIRFPSRSASSGSCVTIRIGRPIASRKCKIARMISSRRARSSEDSAASSSRKRAPESSARPTARLVHGEVGGRRGQYGLYTLGCV